MQIGKIFFNLVTLAQNALSETILHTSVPPYLELYLTFLIVNVYLKPWPFLSEKLHFPLAPSAKADWVKSSSLNIVIFYLFKSVKELMFYHGMMGVSRKTSV